MWAIVPREGLEPSHLSILDPKSSVTTNSTTKAYLGEWWVTIPLPPESQLGTLPIELQTPYKKPHSVSGEVDLRHRRCENKSLASAYTLCASRTDKGYRTQ